MIPSKPAVVLLSGGLDSATVLAMACDQGYACTALSFIYGQRHHHEVEAATRIARSLGAAAHHVITLDLGAVGGSSLTSEAMSVPKDQPIVTGVIPSTYVPARNTIMLSYALAWAEVLQATDIFIGVNAVDYSGYPDCRAEYIAAFTGMANLATRAGVEGHPLTIHAPLQTLSKAEIIQAGLSLGVDYSLTTSCYDPAPDGAACGHCDACHLRLDGFARLGLKDPVRYAA